VATVIEPKASSLSAQQAELLRLRSKYLKKDRILGPAWMILTKLDSGRALGQAVEVCDLISVPCVPATTAQKCLDHLLDRGLVRLGRGPGKRFRTVELAPEIDKELQVLLASIDEAGAEEPSFMFS
jgi:hypothetical protein